MDIELDVGELRDALLGLKKNKGEVFTPSAMNESYVMIESEDDSVRLSTGSDDLFLEVEIEESIVREQGRAVCPLMTLDKIVRKLKKKGGSLYITSDDESSQMEVRHASSGFSYTNHTCEVPDTFDGFPAEDVDLTTVPNGEVQRVCEFAKPYVPSNPDRRRLKGMRLIDDEMHATDGKRLIMVDHALGDDWDGERISHDAVKAIEYITRVRADGTPLIDTNESWAVAEKGSWTIRGKLVDEGLFPDVDQILPGENEWESTVEVSYDHACEAIDMLGIVASSKSPIRVETGTYSESEMTWSTSNTETVDEASQDLGETLDREADLKLSFTEDYLEDAIDTFDHCSHVKMDMIDRTSPTRFRSDEDPTVTSILMPRLD